MNSCIVCDGLLGHGIVIDGLTESSFVTYFNSPIVCDGLLSFSITTDGLVPSEFPIQKTVVPVLLIAPSPPDAIFGAVTTGIGVPTASFTVQPVEPYSGVISMSDGATLIPNASGILLLPSPSSVFNPPTLTFFNSIEPQTFTYTPISKGYKQISISGYNASPSAPIWVYANPHWPNRN